MPKRTTIEIDEDLLARAKRALGQRTTRATVEGARAPLPALGEFAEGFENEDDSAVVRVRKQYTLLPSDTETALTYSRIARALRSRGRLIGVNDLWIAAASVRHELPLVTANTAEFGRVDGLEVVAYR